MNEYKKSVIVENIKARHEEIAGYEINIFNYEYIASRTQDDAFKAQVSDGVEGNKREMAKAKLVLEALEAQLASLN